MAFDARVLQILIASPGDVAEERRLLSEIISEWNYVNARERRVVLLPLRWETHASPELGSSPQAVINRQVVDSCDMAVGVFWTRLGTPTDTAESGTAEEIARVGSAGKPVMLYFSKAKVDLDSVDLEEYARLREFKKKTSPTGLVENYESLADFREKFARQLAIKIPEIIAQDTEDKTPDNTDPRASLSLELLRASSGMNFHRRNQPDTDVAAQENVTSVTGQRLVCADTAAIPDFGLEVTTESPQIPQIGVKRRFHHDFLVRVVAYSCQPPVFGPFRLAVTASNEHGLRDTYIEIRVSGLRGYIMPERAAELDPPEPYLVQDPDAVDSQVVALAPSKRSQLIIETVPRPNSTMPDAQLVIDKDDGSDWLIKMELPAIQAGRKVRSPWTFWIAAEGQCTPSFDATIYSSDFTPFASHLDLDIQLEESVMPYQAIVDQFLARHPLPN